MNRIEGAFKKGKVFIPFLTCGDPDLETTEKLIVAMAHSGADIIELGIPFSDPMAEGPVIQRANQRALSGSVNTDKVFKLVREVREKVEIPLLFMTYGNVVFSYGSERFMREAADSGIDGIILPDVPYEEKKEFSQVCEKYGVQLISMVSPTSDKRIQKIAKEANGFLYCVSSMGVTGVRKEIETKVEGMIATVRQASSVPAVVGFGISTPEQAESIVKYADGVIVGSAIVKLIELHGKEGISKVAEYVRNMKNAISERSQETIE